MNEERRSIVTGVAKIWATLLVLGAASLAYALLPGLPGKLPAALAIVIVQAALVLGGFMRLGQSSALVRTTVLVGVVWLGFLFLMTFADLWTR
jgi:cytochrome c oxidase subunit 4